VDAERGPEKRLLDVVHGEAVPAEQRLHVAVTDEAGEVRSAARMDRHRARDDDDLPAPLAEPTHLPCDAIDGELDAPLARRVRGHEAESLARARQVRRVRAHAVDAADDAVADPEIADQPAGDRRFAGAVDDEHRVHALARRAEPASADPYLRRKDRRAVEVWRCDARLAHRLETRVPLVLGDPRAGLEETRQDLLEPLRRRRDDPDARDRRLVVAEPRVERLDLEAPAGVGDAVEGAVHHVRVEEIALELDLSLADAR